MNDIEKIRNEALTEDAKMEIVADLMDSGTIVTMEINDVSGTLSDEDFAKVQKDNCIVKSSTEYYYKQYSAAGVIRYGALPRIGTGKIIFDYIDIDKNTKTYELKNESYPAE